MRQAALYLRVSTLDQTTANQERELRAGRGRIEALLMEVQVDLEGMDFGQERYKVL